MPLLHTSGAQLLSLGLDTQCYRLTFLTLMHLSLQMTF